MEIPQEILEYCESCWKWDADIRQEVYLRILALPPESEINKHWCVVTYDNLRADAYKITKRRRELLADNEDQVRSNFFADNQGDDPSYILSAAELMDDRMDALSTLVRRTMVRHYADGVGVEDIAVEEKVDPKAVYERLRLGRNMLKGE
jgi:DNA-directed RNA polymerase specialized sigma24 family protein